MGINVQPSGFVRLPTVQRPQLLGRGVLTVGPDVPPASEVGDLWWRTPDGALYLYYDDGSSAQWVAANPVPAAALPGPPRWIEFPNPPLTVGQTFTATNGVTYTWDGVVWAEVPWQGVPAGGSTGMVLEKTSDADFAIAWMALQPFPTSLPPSGPAGGDLGAPGSTYPNPTIAAGAVTDAKIATVGWSKVTGAPAFLVAPISAGQITSITWGQVTGAPAFVVAPISAAQITSITWSQVTGVIVTRSQLAPGATNGAVNFTAIPTSLSWGGTSALPWTTVITGSITTRGGIVCVSVNSSIAGSAPGASGNVSLRLWVDGARQATEASYLMNSTSYVPIPGPNWSDNPAAGAHVYQLQIALDANCYAETSGVGGGGMLLQEIG